MSFFDPRRQPQTALRQAAAQPEGRLIGALDFGASKTICLIGRDTAEGLEIAGMGLAKPQAGSDGAPLDFDACVRAIRIAVDQAERVAGETISAVAAGFGGKGLISRRVQGMVQLPPGPIGPKAVRAALNAALGEAPGAGRTLLHAIPMGYRVDDGHLLADPRGAEGKTLAVELTLVSAPAAAVAALVDCIGEAGLRVTKVIASPYAAGLAVLSPEECLLGAVALDFGAAHVGVAARA
jgi:cell division protein FtsA